MRSRSGQAVLGAALSLTVLLILLAGLHVAGRGISLSGSVESAAFTQTLREGRRQAGIESSIAESILPRGEGIFLRTHRKKVSSLVPSILPSPEGRTRCSVRIENDWIEAGGIASWPSLSAERWIEASVDCWDRKTPSGRRTSTAVRAYVLLRSIR